MVDFNKFRAQKNQPTVVDPLEIYRRLPKPDGINDLYTSQAEVLRKWSEQQNQQDIVIKLHTGGGKTLVGLLIAQSLLNNYKSPVVYLAATKQLVDQTAQKAAEYSIPSVIYERGVPLPDEFLAGKKTLIATYHALFNGHSRFGVLNSGNPPLRLGGLILDDAHVTFSTIREQFTIKIAKKETKDSYEYLTSLFRSDFSEIEKRGSFDDIVQESSFAILEVPYWSWIAHLNEIQQYLAQQYSSKKSTDNIKYVWPLIRDELRYSHCFISSQAITITPLFPLIDLFPSFGNCPRRIFMSATTGDDSGIVQTFNADKTSVSKPIVSNSLAGVSERLILIPNLMRGLPDNIFEMLTKIVENTVKHHKVGTIILAPSNVKAKQWEETATVATSTDLVGEYVQQLQDGSSKGPFVFVNRYDGIDLPGNACRLLVMSELPSGIDDYDSHQAIVFQGSEVIDNAIARRVEQGIGRGARGAGDYCIVILYGNELASWLSRHSNQQLLTSSTRAQIAIGQQVSQDINSETELLEMIERALTRDADWVRYHAETLAELTQHEIEISVNLDIAALQRNAFDLVRKGYTDKAVSKIKKFLDEQKQSLDPLVIGWLYQLASRFAYLDGLKDESEALQKQAYAHNRALFRPKQGGFYRHLVIPSKQSEAIVSYMQKFQMKRGVLAEFDSQCSLLTRSTTANQFEEALAHLGRFLGFTVERPESADDVGPDVVWLTDQKQGFVIEAKSRKEIENPLTKAEHGQLLDSVEWFKNKYPEFTEIPVSVHPNPFATKNVSLGEVKVLTLEKLNTLVSETRKMYEELSERIMSKDELVVYCQSLLNRSNLTSEQFPSIYLEDFKKQ